MSTGDKKTISCRNRDYRNQLMTFAASEIAALIASTPFKDRLWLRNPQVLNGEDNHADRVLLQYSYTNPVPADRLLDEILIGLQQWPKIFGKQTEPYFTAEGTVTDENMILLTLYYENKRIPVAIGLTRDPDPAVEPKVVRHSMVLDPDRFADILEMSFDDEAAECFATIIEKLELITDMSPYGRLCELIRTRSLRGRYIAERIEHFCDRKNIRLSKERLEIFLEYGDYIYMERKWDKYKKRHKDMSLSWKETHEKVSLFVKPIYEAISGQEVFFGDWMPELGRFLD